MDQKHHFHMFSNGNDAQNFIICKEDFYAEFNITAVCVHNSGAGMLAFSIEETHAHFVLYGTYGECTKFKNLFQNSSMSHIRATRRTTDNVHLDFHLSVIEDVEYLRNVSIYTIAQATKDGKSVMPYDYLWGTGSLYFRQPYSVPIWYYYKDGIINKPYRIGELSKKAANKIKHSKMPVPDDWLVCNDYILPSNYIDTKQFESIFKTHNCFRAFMSSGRNKDTSILDKMADSRGVMLDDLELRRISETVCIELFKTRTARWLSTTQRMELAKHLWKEYHISYRQLSSVCRIPEEELREYIK